MNYRLKKFDFRAPFESSRARLKSSALGGLGASVASSSSDGSASRSTFSEADAKGISAAGFGVLAISGVVAFGASVGASLLAATSEALAALAGGNGDATTFGASSLAAFTGSGFAKVSFVSDLLISGASAGRTVADPGLALGRTLFSCNASK